METEKIRIKDIAERAGVSSGTVDRVLHGRPNVSPASRERVEKALKEMHYQPNMYASALSHNKSYTFYLLLPEHGQEAYWEEVEKGASKECDARRDFNIHIRFLYFQRFNEQSFKKQCETCLSAKPDGVILVPSIPDITTDFAMELHRREIPFVLLDAYMPELKPLAFYGQDSISSGYFAARMLMLLAQSDKEVMIMRLTIGDRVLSKQQHDREIGFRKFMSDHYPQVLINSLDLPTDRSQKEWDKMLDDYFSLNPDTHHCITFGSKAHIVGEYLLRRNCRQVQIMGYDMVSRNESCLREGSISFLIAQHAYMQGYFCVEALFLDIVLKKRVPMVNYMPIELITPENVDFYRRTQL